MRGPGGNHRGNRTFAPSYRETNRTFEGALIMEIILAVLLVVVSLVFLAIAVDATRHPKQ